MRKPEPLKSLNQHIAEIEAEEDCAKNPGDCPEPSLFAPEKVENVPDPKVDNPRVGDTADFMLADAAEQKRIERENRKRLGLAIAEGDLASDDENRRRLGLNRRKPEPMPLPSSY